MSKGGFDHKAAAKAVAALQDTVALVQRHVLLRDGLAGVVLRSWQGPDADSFRTQRHPAIKSQAATTIGLLNNLITSIQDASTAAAKDPGAAAGPGKSA